MLLEAIVQAFWFFIPAYIANPTAVLFGGGAPIDSGKILWDGRRLFGDGKTWRGFFGGIISGLIVGSFQIVVGLFVPAASFGPLPEIIPIIVLLPLGALLGDIFGSFVKRRLGKEKGAQVLGLDQYDFVLGSFLLLLLFQREWFLQRYWQGDAMYGMVFIILITPLLHRAVNIMGYRMGKKEVPW